ncbi:MAG TPA: hypothetical protein VEE86_03675 [Thermoplasmata archaeon]|nr:hypothetical protein [Thermoplasmata archaeon]
MRRDVPILTVRRPALWSTSSEIATLSPRTRAWCLGERGRLADDELGGPVRPPS